MYREGRILSRRLVGMFREEGYYLEGWVVCLEKEGRLSRRVGGMYREGRNYLESWLVCIEKEGDYLEG